MVSSIGGITSRAVEFALDGLSLRHNAIASNIANSGAVGYRPMHVDFESKIAAMLESQNVTDLASAEFSSMAPHVSFGSPINTESGQGMFETNMVMLNQNVVQYEALIKGFGVYAALISEAIKEGKR